MPLGVTGNTSDSGSEESWFEPRRGNTKRSQHLSADFASCLYSLTPDCVPFCVPLSVARALGIEQPHRTEGERSPPTGPSRIDESEIHVQAINTPFSKPRSSRVLRLLNEVELSNGITLGVNSSSGLPKIGNANVLSDCERYVTALVIPASRDSELPFSALGMGAPVRR